MYIAIEQMNPTAGALRENCAKALARVQEHAKSQYPPDLIVFPAFALTGLPVQGLWDYEPFCVECLEEITDFANQVEIPVLIGGLLPQLMEDGRFKNAPEVFYVHDGYSEQIFTDGFFYKETDILDEDSDEYLNQDKTGDDNADDDDNDDAAVFPYFELSGEKVGVLFNEIPDVDDECFAKVDIVIALLSKSYVDEPSVLSARRLLKQNLEVAKESNIWIVCANLAGSQEDIVYQGSSMVISPKGKLVAVADVFNEQSLLVNLSDLTPEIPNPKYGFDELEWLAIVSSIRDYLQKSGFSDCVIGLSGGIDSAVTAALAVDALGCEHVHGVLMPSENSSPESITDAEQLAKNLGIQTITLPIAEAYQCFTGLYQEILGNAGSDLALQNIQARIRTVHLMHLSNSFGWMLLNTGNKSEAAMGYSTLYGDTAGAFAPLGNTYKTDVYYLAEWYNKKSPRIPEAIIDKAPSAELYAGQKDTDSLPDYYILDAILRLHIEEECGIAQIYDILANEPEIAGEISVDMIADVLQRVAAAEYKRRQEPLAPRLDQKSMNDERSWPIVNGYREKPDLAPSNDRVLAALKKMLDSAIENKSRTKNN